MIRYVIMFFDYSFPQEHSRREYFRRYFGSGRRSEPVSGGRRMSKGKVSALFGVSQPELVAMSKAEVTKLYRKRALELYPADTVGEDDLFIVLTAAYNDLLQGKSG